MRNEIKQSVCVCSGCKYLQSKQREEIITTDKLKNEQFSEVIAAEEMNLFHELSF